MGTTAQKLAYLSDTKAVIKQAIVSKGIAVPDGTTFREYAKKISSIHDVSSLPTQDAKTVIPTTSEQIAVASGTYTTGDVKVAGDANLVPENIAEGVSIFGVQGASAGGGIGTGSKVYYDGYIFATFGYICDDGTAKLYKDNGPSGLLGDNIIYLWWYYSPGGGVEASITGNYEVLYRDSQFGCVIKVLGECHMTEYFSGGGSG